MQKSILTEPTVEPITLQEAKDHLIVEHDEDDLWIYNAVVSARKHFEARCDRVLVRQQWRLYMDRFEDFELQPYKVQEVEQIQYTDIDGATQTLDTSIYTVDIPRQMVYTAYNQVYPAARDVRNAVWADVWAGEYKVNSPIDLTTDIPQDIKGVLYYLIEDFYKNRGSTSEVSMFRNETYDALLQPHIKYANR